jgi:hypothetical protein
MTPPVLLLVFNRPDTTARVMEATRAARPARLYVAADGPRSDRPGEAERCQETRRVATDVDWPCEVRTLFRDENLRGPKAVPAAIDWFFEHEEEGVILEDDCLPSADFFRFCGEMLERWRDDERVMAVCGSCYARPNAGYVGSYCASYYADIWGWATWRRAWGKRDSGLDRWTVDREAILAAVAGRSAAAEYWTRTFDELASGKRDHWDYRWMAAVMANAGVAIHPVRNLVSNLGVRADASNTMVAPGQRLNLPADQPHDALEFPLTHPKELGHMPEIDREIEARRLGIRERNLSSMLGGQMKWAARMMLGEEAIGRVEYHVRPELRDPWGGPFNGQAARAAAFAAIVDRFSPAAIVETGTFRATTTELFARTRLRVFTVEGLSRNYGFAKARLGGLRNVTLVRADSRDALRQWFAGPLKTFADLPLFFYLDAHWNADLPLAEELDIIFPNCPRAIVMVDDFQVPDDPGYGYDDYGTGKALTASYVAPAVGRYGLGLFYPAVPASMETGARRGSVVLASRDIHGAALAQILRSHEPSYA